MSELPEKDPLILDALESLYSRPGRDTFVLADHWESDLCAIGIANPANQRVLVYISCHGELPDHFYYELELPAPPGSDSEYLVTGRAAGVLFDDLVEVIYRHLQNA